MPIYLHIQFYVMLTCSENLELVFIDSAHVFSANLYAELRQKHLQYDSIPADFFLAGIKIMLENRT